MAVDARLKYELAPQMRDAEQQPYQWLPYLMRRAQPGFRSPTLCTDALGFRATYAGGKPVEFAEWSAGSGRRAAITGNSSTFGVGTSNDRHTVASRLNDDPRAAGRLWYNMAQRASTLTQERLSLEFHAPLDLECIVWISGLNDVIAMILGEGGSPGLAPFIGEPRFLKAMGQAPVSAAVKPEDRYASLLESIARDFRLVRSAFADARILFALQPALAWCDKPLHPNERALVDIFDATPNRLHHAHAPQALGPWQSRFSRDLAGLAARSGMDFLDINREPAFNNGDWLFIDRIHITDRGHEHIAEIVAAWLEHGAV
jgi:lysophospholipase L1-like esterase